MVNFSLCLCLNKTNYIIGRAGQTEHCIIPVSKGNYGRKYNINGCVCVFWSVNSDCTQQHILIIHAFLGNIRSFEMQHFPEVASSCFSDMKSLTYRHIYVYNIYIMHFKVEKT